MGLSRVFKTMDNDGNKKLDKDEFYYGLNEIGI
jgi:hypothetical protein